MVTPGWGWCPVMAVVPLSRMTSKKSWPLCTTLVSPVSPAWRRGRVPDEGHRRLAGGPGDARRGADGQTHANQVIRHGQGRQEPQGVAAHVGGENTFPAPGPSVPSSPRSTWPGGGSPGTGWGAVREFAAPQLCRRRRRRGLGGDPEEFCHHLAHQGRLIFVEPGKKPLALSLDGQGQPPGLGDGFEAILQAAVPVPPPPGPAPPVARKSASSFSGRG